MMMTQEGRAKEKSNKKLQPTKHLTDLLPTTEASTVISSRDQRVFYVTVD
jgi:hypothetical protein